MAKSPADRPGIDRRWNQLSPFEHRSTLYSSFAPFLGFAQHAIARGKLMVRLLPFLIFSLRTP